MKNTIKLLTTLIFCLLLSCSKSNDNPIAAPQVSYVQELTAAFFTEGQSEPPQVNWNGDLGQFRLESSIDGIAINATTGVISWDNSLSPGVHPITVLAFNDAGDTKINVQLENIFSGTFKGNWTLFGDSISTIEITFRDDETAVLTINENAEQSGPGTWILTSADLSGDFFFSDTRYDLNGELTHSQTEAFVAGTLRYDNPYDGFDGPFRIDIAID